MEKKKTTQGPMLRWHLTRIYEDERFGVDQDRSVHVTVHRGAKALAAEWGGRDLAAIRFGTRENLDWWARDPALEGEIAESELVRALLERNVARPDDASPAPRRLAEDMVLLQALPDEQAWDEAVQRAAATDDLLDLSALAAARGSRWVDMTRPARRASKQRYLRALREAGPDVRGGGYAGKR